MSENPLVSIITPSYNQGEFIEDTIVSVKNQDYSNIEHIIVDGGSTDNTLEILRKYEGTYNMRWISESDKGQSDGINKGFRMCRGEIIGWLNSDDTYEPNAISTIAEYLLSHPEVAMVFGVCNWINEFDEVIGQGSTKNFSLKLLLRGYDFIPQPATFLRKYAWEIAGPLDVTLHYVMDYDLWIRIGQRFTVHHIPNVLANYRICKGTKTVSMQDKFWPERLRVYHRYGGGYFSLLYLQYIPRMLLHPLFPLGQCALYRWPWLRKFMRDVRSYILR